MAYNKARLLDAAQKLLNQGKIAQAVAQYQEILHHEPDDQVTLMTIGDLYVRNGEASRGVEYFQRLADIFQQEGFTSKAIAIYKKIAKLAPQDIASLERLADLYAQQGVMSEARPLLLHLAEEHLKRKKLEAAVAVLQKLLELEPDNLRVQLRVAELCQNLGQRREAVTAYVRSAERMLASADFAETHRLAARALEIDTANAHATLLKARALAGLERVPEAIAALEAMQHPGPEHAQLLLDLYLKSNQTERAVEFARKCFAQNPKAFGPCCEVAAALTAAGEADRALALLDHIGQAMMAAGEYDALAKALNAVSECLPGRTEPLERLVDLYRRSNDSFRLPDALARLGSAAAAAGDLERARVIYEELVERSGDELARQRLNELRAQLGMVPMSEPVGPPSAAPPLQEPALLRSVDFWMDAETRRFVNQAMTDVDLFASYGLTPKAIELLGKVLGRAPRYPPALEKLLELCLGAGEVRRTAELAYVLEEIYRAANDAARTERFAELRRRFQRASGISDEELQAAAAAMATEREPVVEPEAQLEVAEPAPEPAAETEPAVYEVDLSEEWARLAREAAQAAASPAAPAAVPEPRPEEPVPAVAAKAIEQAAKSHIESATSSVPPPPPMAGDAVLTELAAEIEGLEATLTQPSPPAPVAGVRSAPPKIAEEAPPARAKPAPPVAAEQSPEELRQVFDEFRAELGALTEEEDPETRYNLGIAYREMGLLEEAISEFQKVFQAVENGQPFRYAMQCCTLLALSFMEKGQPKIAAMWYRRALEVPGLAPETRMALRYDLGRAFEQAGETAAALDSYLQVYAMNIDYRDVAERIAALQQR